MDEQLELFKRDETQHNVFFAAVPDASLIASTGEIARNACRGLGLSGAPILPQRLHVSLLAVGGFSGSCSAAVIDAAMRAAGAVSMRRSRSRSITSRAFPQSLESGRSC